MFKTLTAIALMAFTTILGAQTVANFENLGLMTGEFLNGSDLGGGFESGNIYLPNNFNASYQSWLGWAISATTDTVTPGFNNQYSSIVGEGAEGSTSYGVNFSFGPNIVRLNEAARGAEVNGLYITNSTYAFLSMRDGDAFAKRFGGETGDDPDFFKLTIKKYLEGNLGVDSVDFFLADYRFDDNAEDYLVDTWTWVDLTTLGDCDSLWFNLSSSDNGQFGMNTPSFFCIDNVTTEDVSTGVQTTLAASELQLFPNPVAGILFINLEQEKGEVFLIDSRGVTVRHVTAKSPHLDLDVQSLVSGTYYVQLITSTGMITKTIIKE